MIILEITNSEDKIYDFANKKKNEITALLLKYTRQLRTAKELGDRTIDEMLENPTYIGNMTQGRRKRINYKILLFPYKKKHIMLLVFEIVIFDSCS